MIESGKGDILVRIHTAIHKPDEAVELARFIKDIIPGAHILGTSTSAIISGGKLIGDQCVISITQMSEGSIRCARIPVTDEAGIVPPSRLIEKVKQAVIGDDTKEMLIFFTEMYRDINHFVDQSNTELPGVYDVENKTVLTFQDTEKGTKEGTTENLISWEEIRAHIGDEAAEKLSEELELLDGAGAEFDLEAVRKGVRFQTRITLRQ